MTGATGSGRIADGVRAFRSDQKQDCPLLGTCGFHSPWWRTTYCKDRWSDCSEYLTRWQKNKSKV